MKSDNIDYNRINYGFALLRMLMAFEVILAHFCNWDEYDLKIVWPFRELVSLAVSCFVIVSFYLLADSFKKRDKKNFINRLKRLIIPQIGWAFVYFFVFLLLNIFFNANLEIGLNDLFWQLLTGHSMNLNPTLWYQFDIIIVTVIFYFIFKYCDDDKAFKVLIGLLVFCYILQYSGINRMLFGDLPFELKKPLGRIVEVIPFAVIGFSLKHLNILEKLKTHRLIVMLSCVVLFLLGFYIPWIEVKNFDYGGFTKPYLSLCIVIFSYLIPLDGLPDNFKKVILKITDYTMGIYCCHRMVYMILIYATKMSFTHSFEKCILIYLISYFLCFLLDTIDNPYIKKMIR